MIINSYNYGEYIELAVESAINQTLDKSLFEVILVDDGSTDDTYSRIEKFLPEIVYHYKENGGQASALNAGVAIAKGEFIAFLDADDYWRADKLEKVLEEFRRDPEVGVIYHTLSVIDKKGQHIETLPKWFDRIIVNNPVQNYDDWITVNGSATSGISFRAEALQKIMPIPEVFKICADGYIMSSAPLTTRKFGLINTELGYYKIHGENRFSCLTEDGKSLTVRDESINEQYFQLFTEHVNLLIKKLNFPLELLPKLFQAQRLRDRIFEIKREKGRIIALQQFWHSRIKLSSLPTKYRLFRFTGILARLLLTENAYFFFRKVYAETFLWRIINCRY